MARVPPTTEVAQCDYRKVAEVASPTAVQDLQRLRRDGWLDQQGGGRSVRYIAGGKLSELWSAARRP